MTKNREEKLPPGVTQEETVIPERKLVEASQQGDQKAFGLLIRRHQKRLFRFIYGLTGSFDQTEDIVQEAFIKAHGAIKTFRAGYDFYPWLSTIARNLAYNQLTRGDKTESLETKTEKGFDSPSPQPGPLERLLNSENQKRFYEALGALPEKYRVVFVLRHFEDLDYSQIAGYLKIPPGTVDSRLYRARKMLTEALKDLLE